MGWASKSGRAVTNPSDPRAFGVCDRCGIWFNLWTLRYQYEWQGSILMNLRFRVCSGCMDIPNPQLMARRLPPDPVPVHDPRPEPWLTPGFMDRNIATQGFSPIETEVGSIPSAGLPIEVEPGNPPPPPPPPTPGPPSSIQAMEIPE
jgi:hypothetical protein